MNIMIYWQTKHGEMELVTPSLDQGVILPGITRESLLTLAREWDEFVVTERAITMSEFVKTFDDGRVREGKLFALCTFDLINVFTETFFVSVFGCGTACVICPVKSITYDTRTLDIAPIDKGLATKFRNALNDLHRVRVKKENWQVYV